MRRFVPLVTAVAVALAGVALVAPPANAATIDGLTGTGSAGDPLVIDSASDLNAAAAAVNGSYATYGSLAYRLDADIDYAGATFAKFAKFSGSFDGNGHVIDNFTVTVGTGALSSGFFQELNGGSVTDLTLRHGTATTANGQGKVGLIAGQSTNAVIAGNTILDSAITLGTGGATNTQASFIAASAIGSTVENNLVKNSTVQGNKYAGGIVAYPTNSTGNVIRKNLVVDSTVTAITGGAGSSASFLIAQNGLETTVSGNVIVRGGIGTGTAATIENRGLGLAPMTVPKVNYYSTATALTLYYKTPANAPTTAQVTSATLTPATETALADLTDQETYEDLNWDFAAGTGDWRWDSALDIPVPARADLPGQGGISYNLNAGVDPGNPSAYSPDSADIALLPPTREHYIFDGWTGTDLNERTINVTIAAGSTGDRSYTAHWDAVSYELSYDLAGGVASPANPDSYSIESDTIHLVAPTRSGYIFDGWTGTDVAEPTVDVTVASGSTGARSYTANWTEVVGFAISYDLAGGTVDGTNPLQYNDQSDEFTLINPTRAGYIFAGWTGTDIAEQSTTVTVPEGSTGDRAYTAHWSVRTYSVDYTLSGGAVGGSNPATYTVESNAFTVANPTRTGFTFAGWTGTGISGASTAVTVASGSTGDRSYIATWVPISYTLSYDLAGGAVDPANPTTFTVESTEIVLANPTRARYDFAGWTGTGISEATTTVTIPPGATGNRSYTATWTAIPATIDGLDGEGTQAAPYEISTPAELDLAAAAVNADYATYGQGHFTLTADIDYSGSEFVKFALFSGSFDGNGHVIKNISFLATDVEVGLFQILDGATVTDLTLQKVTAATTDGDGNVGIIAGRIYNSTVRGNTILDSSSALGSGGANNTQAGGIAGTTTGKTLAGASGTTTIADNVIVNSTVRGQKYAAGLVAYPLNSGNTVIEDNLLIDVTVVAPTAGGGSTAGLLAAQGTGVGNQLRNNVIIRGGTAGSIALTRAVANSGWATVGADNLVSSATSFAQAESPVAGYTGTVATLTPATETELRDLTDQATYEGLGWEFPGVWAWSDALGFPVQSKSVLPTYVISYALAGGVDGGSPAIGRYGEALSLKSPTREGYLFAGWTGTALTDPTVSVTLPLYGIVDRAYSATWTAAEQRISYDLAGGTLASENPLAYTVESDSFTLANPTRAGYEFAGWTGTGLNQATTTVTVATGSLGARSYTAQWTPSENVIAYDLVGGDLVGVNPTVYTVQSDTFTLVNPTKAGYTFAGWTGTGLDQATTTVTVTAGSLGDRSYTALWTPIVYGLYFDTAEGDFTESPRTNYSIESGAFTLIAPVRTGYTFAGWTGTGLTEPTVRVTIALGSVGDRIFVATWTPTVHTITYNLGGGTASANRASFTIESPTFTLNAPTRAGYTFAGWTGTGLNGAVRTVSITVGSTGDRAYTATWNAVVPPSVSAPTPTISGTARVGNTLTVKAGTWTPAPVTLKYQWMRNGASISGATGASYTLAAADAQKKVSVRVTGSKTGFTSTVKTSTAKTIAKGVLAAKTPKITGKAKVGRTLKAVAGTWQPAKVTVKYQWYKNGKKISGATKQTYKVKASVAGKKITVKVTGSKTGYTTVVKTSAAKKAVK